MTFFNTIQAPDQLQIVFEAAAKTQEDAVLEAFRLSKSSCAWFEIKGFLPDMNESSLKRCLTNLMNKGLLIKNTNVDQMVMGPYGKGCHTYYLNPLKIK